MVRRSPQRQAIIVQLSPPTQSFNQTTAINKKLFNLCLKIASAWSLFGIAAFVPTPVFAQSAIAEGGASPIAPDNTLGAESSNVVTNFNGSPIEVITGGATRGINLFHSFREFNVSEGRGAYFLSPSADIQNILARVTGANRSEILGILGTFQINNVNIAGSKANLFLMNPNGIIFEKSASLDVGGSFAATTANAIAFGERGNFSATNPEVPQLLTINPSAFLFSQINKTASIQNNSTVPAGTTPAGFDAFGLRIPDGKSLLLVGGDVSINGGQLNAFGGRVELGGLAEPGNINLYVNSDSLSLGFSENVARGDVSLSDQARVYVEAAGGGDIAINARNIEISGGSILFAGIGQGLGIPETVAGDITLNATGEIKIADFESGIGNLVRSGSQGNGGNITINANSFNLQDGAQLAASSIGKGNAGNVTLTAKDSISLVGQATAIFSTVEVGGVGNSGNITIDVGLFKLGDGAEIVASTFGQGNAGSVTVTAKDSISLIGGKFFSTVGEEGVGDGGSIEINTATLSLQNSSQIATSSFGQGNAGNITVNAKDAISLAGGQTSIFSTVEVGGVGKGGNININAASLSLKDGAQILTATRETSEKQPTEPKNAGDVSINVTGEVDISGTNGTFPSGIGSSIGRGRRGNGGNITIDANSFKLRDGAQLIASTDGEGNAGNVSIKVSGELDIAGKKDTLSSTIFSDVGTGAEGNGGNITIDAASFNLRDSAQLAASTSGRGNAGNVTVTAKDAVSLFGEQTTIFSTVEAGGVGEGGNIDINAATLSLQDGAQLLTSTREASDTQKAGQGDAGNITLKVTGEVDIASKKKAIVSSLETGAEGKGGNITIDAGSFKLWDGSQIATSTFGQGNAGNITVNAKDAISLAGGQTSIFSTVEAGGVGKGGNININAASLSLKDGAQILTSTRETSENQPTEPKNAGDVSINVTGEVDISGTNGTFPSGILSNIGRGRRGNGGNITIDANSFKLRDGAQLIASTDGEGNAGNVTVTAKDSVSLVNGQVFSTVGVEGIGKGGNIDINAANLSLQNSAQLAASTFGQGNAGNVTVTAKDAVSLFGEQTTIFSTVEAGGVGEGGNIDINAATLSLQDGAQLLTITRGASNTQPAGRGNAGDVNLKVDKEVDIAGVQNGVSSAIFSRVDIGTEGNGGNITIDASSFKLQDGALIDARTQNNNRGGDIKVNANVFETLNGGQVITTTSGGGRAGKITVNTTDKVIISGSDPNYKNRLTNFPNRNENIGANSGLFVSSTGSGITGDIEVNSPKITLDNQAKLNAESTSGNGGNINLNSNLLLLRRGGQITTNAGTAQAGGDGGNIDINSRFIVAIPNQNNDITANAYSGKGGNINIQSRGIFGIEPRTQALDKTNDITASSQLGLSGNVDVNSPDNSSIQNSLTLLPTNAIDTNVLIANSCIARANKKQENSFIITGGGALPNRPGNVLMSDYSTDRVRGVNNEITLRPWKKGDPIVEPTGVYRLSDGRLVMSRECE